MRGITGGVERPRSAASMASSPPCRAWLSARSSSVSKVGATTRISPRSMAACARAGLTHACSVSSDRSALTLLVRRHRDREEAGVVALRLDRRRDPVRPVDERADVDVEILGFQQRNEPAGVPLDLATQRLQSRYPIRRAGPSRAVPREQYSSLLEGFPAGGDVQRNCVVVGETLALQRMQLPAHTKPAPRAQPARGQRPTRPPRRCVRRETPTCRP